MKNIPIIGKLLVVFGVFCCIAIGTGQALTNIVRQVGDAHDSVVSIASSAQSQASGLQEVNATIAQMDEVTQQNAAMVEESAAATQSLAQETAELLRLTRQFRIDTSRSASWAA